MSIEFVCPHCEYLLRTADDKAGMSAECPACGDPLWIPYPEELESSGQGAEPAGADDPWSRPSAGMDYPGSPSHLREPVGVEDAAAGAGAHAVAAGDAVNVRGGDAAPQSAARSESPEWYRDGELWQPRAVDPGEILTRTLELFGKNFGLLVAAGAIELIVGIIAVGVVAIPALMTAALLWDGTAIALFVAVLVWICGFAVATSWLAVGHFRFYLKLARGEEATLSDLIHSGPVAGRMTALNILFGVLTLVGLMMCVIPGLFVMLVYWPYGRLLVDRDLPGLSAFEASRSVTRGHLATNLVLVFTAIGATAACNLIPLGVVISVPFIGLLFSVAYLRMTRQPVGLD